MAQYLDACCHGDVTTFTEYRNSQKRLRLFGSIAKLASPDYISGTGTVHSDVTYIQVHGIREGRLLAAQYPDRGH